MGRYANVKMKRVRSFLRWLETKPSITIKEGGNHQILIQYNFWGRPFPIPSKHGEVNKHIVEDLMRKLVESGICTQEEFDERIK